MAATITPEMLRQVAAELDHWQPLLGRVREIHDGIGVGSEQLANIAVSLLTVQLAPCDKQAGFVLDGLAAVNEAMRQLLELERQLTAIVDLIGSRTDTLAAALEGSTDVRI